MRKITLWTVLCLCVPVAAVFGQQNVERQKQPVKTIVAFAQPETLERQIERVARSYGLDARLFQSLIYTESVFKIRAVSYKGAACYTQLMPATARRFGLQVDSRVDERFNAEKCLTAGAYYLSWLLQTFRGDVRLALAAYNAGEGAVEKYGWRIPPYRETTQYVEKICALYYGQAGHGVAMAYNQPLAQTWVNELYAARGRRSGRNGSNRGLYNAYPQPASIAAVNNREMLPAATAEQKNLPDLKANDNKKPVIARVVVEEANPRIRTQSLSFGNK